MKEMGGEMKDGKRRRDKREKKRKKKRSVGEGEKCWIGKIREEGW